MRKLYCVLMCLLIVTCSAFAAPETHTATAAALEYPTDILELIAYKNSSPFIQGELVNETKTIQRVSSNDANGFKAVLLGLLGDYETVITDYEYRTGSSSYTSHSIQIERDWAWICSAAVLGLVLFCVFRLIGGLLTR